MVIGGTDIGNAINGLAIYGATNATYYGIQIGQDSTHNLGCYG
jgi:hypothetical protein